MPPPQARIAGAEAMRSLLELPAPRCLLARSSPEAVWLMVVVEEVDSRKVIIIVPVYGTPFQACLQHVTARVAWR